MLLTSPRWKTNIISQFDTLLYASRRQSGGTACREPRLAPRLCFNGASYDPA